MTGSLHAYPRRRRSALSIALRTAYVLGLGIVGTWSAMVVMHGLLGYLHAAWVLWGLPCGLEACG
jgi:hypothetical protein